MSQNKPWLKNAVIYNILIDRFSRGNSEPWLDLNADKPVFCGGNLQGIIDRLDYIKDIGANTILLTPFHPTAAYHGYHVLDFFGVDSRFGSLEIIRELVKQAHARNIKVIMDFVLNHVSKTHPYFVDAQSNPQSPFKKWFYFRTWPNQYLSFLNFDDLPKLNLGVPEVKKHIIDAAIKWLDVGFDGIRLDHIIGIPDNFLRELRLSIKGHKPEAVLIGEAVKGKIRWRELKTLQMKYKYILFLFGKIGINTTFFMQMQYLDVLDGMFDFFFRDMVKSFVVKKSWYKFNWLLKLILNNHYFWYPKEFSLISLLDNPDHDRFSFMLKGNDIDLKFALGLQFLQNQPPMFLYGSEAGIQQVESRKIRVYGDKLNGDLAIRGLMPWNDLNIDLINYYKRLIKLHNENKQ